VPDSEEHQWKKQGENNFLYPVFHFDLGVLTSHGLELMVSLAQACGRTVRILVG
jgi:hypothetical protein